jgi:hypothetical protein
MTIPYGGPFNRAGDNSRVAVQGQYVTIEGDVKVTAAPGESPEAKFKAGVANLSSRNPGQARELIWDAMMDWEATGNRNVTSQVLFHWLTAMLSGRTVRQFTEAEIRQLRHYQSWCTKIEGDEWAEGVQLIYRLLDSVLGAPEGADRPKTSMSLPMDQFDGLGKKQRELLHSLDLFLSGPRKDELWREELERARAGQSSADRLAHAWMFFHPDPAKVVLSRHLPEPRTAADRWRVRVSVILFAALTGYLGLELIMQGAVLALLGFVIGLASGIAAVAGDLELRAWPERRHPPRPAVHPAGPDSIDLINRIGKLFEKYFEKYEPVAINRRIWEDATADARLFYRDEITAICLANGYSADEVAWLIRHEVRQMNQRWRNGSPQFPRQRPLPRSGAVTARRVGVAMLVLGFTLAALTAPAHLLCFAFVLISAIWAWRCWLRISLRSSLERAETEEYNRRQEEIDEEYRRWDTRLKERPKDVRMAEWLEADRTVLLGMALDQFHLSRSSLVAHGFLEKPAPGARRAQIIGGLPRYQKYQIWMFLLAEDGVHQLRASLSFLTGTLVEREHISYGYTSIAAVRMLRKSGGVRTYELRLTAGDPITVRVQETDPRPVTQDEQEEDADPAEENKSATEDTAPDVASVTNTLRLLQGVVGGGKNWLREHNWTAAWAGSQAQ